jgi:hypothetical protein
MHMNSVISDKNFMAMVNVRLFGETCTRHFTATAGESSLERLKDRKIILKRDAGSCCNCETLGSQI